MADNELKNIIIIGGGPAGMMAAITAAGDGRSVVVLEHMDKCGKKILATGNGRCNFTNTTINEKCYNSNGDFAMKVINSFDNEELIRFFKGLGVFPKVKNGFVYPYSEQASAICQVLVERLRTLGIEVITSININKITKADSGYKLATDKGTFFADRLIIAAGSKASPKTGSDGSGYQFLNELGVNIVRPLPALTALRSDNKIFKSLSGIRCDARVSVLHGGAVIAEDTGELQLTGYGISGIPVFQVSSHAVRIIDREKKVQCSVDFVPFMTNDEFKEYIDGRIKNGGNNKVYGLFTGLLNSRLTDTLTPYFRLKKDLKLNELGEEEIQRLAVSYKNFNMTYNSYNSYDYAQTCQGGVDVNQINPATMESTKNRHLYFAGEIVDVDGKCGGYNLQWAFSSGYAAGKAAADD